MTAAEPFSYRVTDGWLRDIASEPTPNDPWPCIPWDDQLAADQERFLDVQAELGVDWNLNWGLFIDRRWPVPLGSVIVADRERRLRTFVEAAHARGVKVLTGMGVYSWGFKEIIERVPGVAAGHSKAMCGSSPAAWDWQRRVMDFVMDRRWGLDGLSMQSADLGRCECPKCKAVAPAEYHANLLERCAAHVRQARPDWLIGCAAWGLRLDDPAEFPHVQRISRCVDYLVEVAELTARQGRRPDVVKGLACAFGSVGGVFTEPPQHWDRLRWFLPTGLGSARALADLYRDGGRACEYFFRPFANPVEEVSWRTGAKILSASATSPEESLRQAVSTVYGVAGRAADDLADWFARGEAAYFSRAKFRPGDGSLSLEPLLWQPKDGPAPAVYLRDGLTPPQRKDLAADLVRLRGELETMDLPNAEAKRRTLVAIDGTLKDIAALD